MQRRVLVRARGLAPFRKALVDLALEGGPLAARRRVVLVPTRASAELLRQTIERHAVSTGAPGLVCPDLLTREDWLTRLHAALGDGTRWLTRIERLVLLERALRETLDRRRLNGRPFQPRPGLVAAVLDFYDELRRRQRSVRRFARVVFDELRVERGTDRGSEGLINQTCLLGFAFLAYERGVRASGGLDEHTVRASLLEAQPVLPFDDLIVAVADHPADPRGLWPSDFDLIGRLRQLKHLGVVMTDEAHDAGFRERVEQEFPGIEEARTPDLPRSPYLTAPETTASEEPVLPVFVSRDREEELRGVARVIRHRAEQESGGRVGPAAIVFHRPLPYLYLAQQVMSDAHVPYQVSDALPLAAEPYAALLDLALSVSRTGGAREATMALLRSNLVTFEVVEGVVSGRDVSALDAVLIERRSTGDAHRYPEEVAALARGGAGRLTRDIGRAARAATAAAAAVAELEACRSAGAGSAQVRALASFLRAHERPALGRQEGDERFWRARGAVLSALDGLAEAFERHDDRHREHDEMAAAIHHAIEARTFSPARGHSGVHLVDAAGARFGEFDDVFLVGLVETDWAERPKRNFFYSASLLKALGWPQDADQTRAQQAAFRDVLSLARVRTRLSAFQLEGDAVVSLSTMIDATTGLPTRREPAPADRAVFADEILTRHEPAEGLDPDVADWLALRHRRPGLDHRDYSGFVPAREAEVYRVSQVDRYVTCPFKYFAESVLRLPEERDELSGLTPMERGTLLHGLFERFYRGWQAEGHGAITPANLPEALAAFARLTDETLADLPDPDRTLERMRIIGSMVAPGVADRVFELEAASPAGVVERLLESPLNGIFMFPVQFGLSARAVEIRGTTDRVDVLHDGSLRVVDYKLGRMPDLDSSVQLAVYAHAMQQWLEHRDGRSHPVSAAMYLAFGDDRRFEGKLGRSPEEVALAVSARAGEFVGTIDRIEAGEFPPRPRRPSECQWCGFAGVCRKEYRMEDDEAADPV